MGTEQTVERGIIVFCNWAVFGLVGLGFLLEGGVRDSFLIGMVGVGSIIAGFVGHIVVNAVFRQPFTLGETALGLGVFAVFVLVFALAWVGGVLSKADFYIGLTLLVVVVVGFFVYVTTRYGVRGAFNRFDVIPAIRSGRRK